MAAKFLVLVLEGETYVQYSVLIDTCKSACRFAKSMRKTFPEREYIVTKIIEEQ